MQPIKINRRSVLKSALYFGAVVLTNGQLIRGNSPNDKLNIACIGVGGRGAQTLPDFMREDNIAAVVDVDELRGAPGFALCPNAKKFQDWRVLFDKMSNQIDAVVVSTPDHAHYHPAMAALDLKKHLFCEKPLAHSVYECRRITERAAEQGVQTQLGNMRHAYPNFRRVVELVQSGVLGPITEVHAGLWGGSRGMPKFPQVVVPPPSTIRWDLWIGPAKMRPYAIMSEKDDRSQGSMGDYAPYYWKFWWDFGTGESGNWGCHVMDIPYWALDLKYPTHVKAYGEPVDEFRTPRIMTTEYQFPASGARPACKLVWDVSGKPACQKLWRGKEPFPRTYGAAFVGRKGVLFSSFDRYWVFMNDDSECPVPPKTIPESPGFFQEWTRACKGQAPKPTCSFEYSGPLAETTILANVAYRSKAIDGFQWDPVGLHAIGCPAAQELIKPELYNGYVY